MPRSLWRTLMGGAVQLPRTRQLKKAFQNLVLTLICGLTTILVLKGSTGFENPPSLITDAAEDPTPFFFTNHNRPLIKLDNPHARFLINPKRPFHNRNLITFQNRPSHKSQNPHSEIPSFPAANHKYQSSNPKLPIIRSELQRSRLLATVDNLKHISLLNAPSAEKTENPLHFANPDRNGSLFTTNPSHNLGHSSPHQDDTGSSYENLKQIKASMAKSPNKINEASIDENSNQIGASIDKTPDEIDEASENQDHHLKSDEYDLNLPKWADERLRSSKFNQPSILLVTGSQPFACDNPMGDYHLMKSLKNKMDYCRLHSLDIFYNMANLDPKMSGFWAKLPLIYTLMLAHPEKEWLWWMDSDAMITDMAFELPMERYKDYNLVLHGWKELVFDQKNWVGLNTGSFLIRNCEWSLKLIEEWAPMGRKGKVREEAGHILSKALEGRPDFEADDQSALIYLLNEQKSKWASQVYLENAYNLHGYWLIIVEKYEEMMEKYHSGLGDERWPFVTHFVGCKPCTNTKLALEAKCLKHMERAFNFADNQVLQFYGFQHEALNSNRVLRSTSFS